MFATFFLTSAGSMRRSISTHTSKPDASAKEIIFCVDFRDLQSSHQSAFAVFISVTSWPRATNNSATARDVLAMPALNMECSAFARTPIRFMSYKKCKGGFRRDYCAPTRLFAA